MRLIDADELLTRVRLNYNDHQNVSACAIKEIIDTTSTAYDIDKVVEEITKLRNDAYSYALIYDDEFYYGKAEGLEKALDIINKHLKQR